MDSYKIRLISALTGYGLLVGAGTVAVLHYCLPGFSRNWFLAVFVFFMALETLIINLVVNNSRSKDSKKMVNTYMLTKTLKIVLSLFLVLIYFIIERSNGIKTFAVVLVVFYFLFLVAETFLLTKIEKHIKTKSNNEKPD
jgi:cytochrome c biogenesis factor